MANTKTKAIIFDLDGTIADTIDALLSGINLTMRALGYPDNTRDDVLAHINHGARHLIRLSLPEKYQADEGRVDEALALYNEMYAKTFRETRVPFDGIPEVFRELSARGYRLAVLSNKQDPFVVELAGTLLPAGTVTVARGQRPGAPAKPDPTVPSEILSLLGARPEDSTIVGDAEVDIETARNVGMRVISVSWGYRPREALAAAGTDAIVDSPAELLTLF